MKVPSKSRSRPSRSTGRSRPRKRTIRRKAGRENREAQDAIPKNAILLTNAYEQLVAVLVDHPERLPEFDEIWSERLASSREAEQKVGHDPETFDEELQQYWHRRKEANLFLRLEIEAQRLVPCIRDPRTGEILKLRAKDWIPAEWDEYIPPGIWSDHLVSASYETPGPEGSLVHGALRPVFFFQDEFDAWLADRLGTIQADDATKILQPPVLAKGKLTRDAVTEAVLSIWGASIPAGVGAKRRNEKIRNWLAESGRQNAGDATIRRALQKMRIERD